MSIWDDPEIKAGGEFVKFTAPGDRISGTVNAVRTHRFDDGSVVPQILLTADDGEERTLTAGQVRLKAALAAERPEAGDHLTVVFEREEKRAGGKTLKHFAVTIRRGGAQAPSAGAGAATGEKPPAGVDADTWSRLDPAQREAVRAAMSAQSGAPPF